MIKAMRKDLVVVGAGPAGIAAALKAREKGVKDILLVERAERLGGILNQCVHDGFGLELFKTALTGPEYAQSYIDRLEKEKIPYLLNATVTSLTPGKTLTIVSPQGLLEVSAKAVILATGCRERTREMIHIPGTRPAGVYTAGCAQNLINILGVLPGRSVVILGSGDIGLIMARRLTLEGARVLAVVEILPYASGLRRNIVQCLEDYNIPLFLSHTVVDVKGSKRLEGVTIAQVDDPFKPIAGTEKEFVCDTLLLSVGLIPENELAEKAGVEMDSVTAGPSVNEFNETTVPGIYAAGNTLQVHDLVDWATLEAENAGEQAADYIHGGVSGKRRFRISTGHGVRQAVPQYYSGEHDVLLSLRVSVPFRGKTLAVRAGEAVIKKMSYAELNPAEMQRVKLSKDEVKGTRGLSVSIEDG